FGKSILEPQPGESRPLMESVKDIDVLLLGAGGAARAVAFQVAELLHKGRLLICNRTLHHGPALAEQVRQARRNSTSIKEEDRSHGAPQMQLVINGTTKGQGGVRKLDQGKTISLEFYSALAPAHPVAVPPSEATDFRDESKASEADIKNNNQASIELATSIPKHVCFYDLIYFPEQTVFLRHG